MEISGIRLFYLFKEGPRHPSLVASTIKEDASFIPLKQKLDDKAQKVNNSIILGQYNSLAMRLHRSLDQKTSNSNPGIIWVIFPIW